MADISMCRGKGCNKKETCYRFKALVCKYWQSYIMPDPETCVHYWPIDKGEDRSKEKTQSEEESND